MTKVDSPLSEEELRQIAAIVEALDRSSLTFLQLQIGDMSLTIGKGDGPLPLTATASPVPAAAPAPVAAAAPARAAPAPAQAAPKPAAKAAPAAEPGTVAIVAPIGGRFYAKPDPGAPPFVTLGAEIDASTTVALIEVMKVFNAIPAGIDGTVAQVCVEDAQIVEAGQALFRVRPKA